MRDVFRYLGVLLLFGVGAVHFAAAVVLGLVLASPLRSLPGLGSFPFLRRAPHAVVATGAIVFALGTIIGLLISERGTLFGFHEYGYRTTAALALGLQSGAIAALVAFLILERRRTQAL